MPTKEISDGVPVFSFEHRKDGWYVSIFLSDDRDSATVLGPFDERETAQDAYNAYSLNYPESS